MLSHVRCSMETSIPLEAHAANWRLKGGGGGGVNLAIYKAAGDEATRRHKKVCDAGAVSSTAASRLSVLGPNMNPWMPNWL
ncbi:transcription factor bHLH140 [Selaginella moellendorffii]|uniref:transcription factor bHLH140 n=1 Tax=Selaginella moellendorffii TaxID=88036 RepID=UPI000D1C6DBF|nr:transcription factor bHLH140 [Selaginella moellendorffii]|eukprot:XP_024536825.1 transcription factor bHLH140 [Selaginella moellendorffii]